MNKEYEIRELSLDEGTIYIVLSEKKYIAAVKFDTSNYRCSVVDGGVEDCLDENVYFSDGTIASKRALVCEAVSNFLIDKIKNKNTAYHYYY